MAKIVPNPLKFTDNEAGRETKLFIEIVNKIETELLAKYPEQKCIVYVVRMVMHVKIEELYREMKQKQQPFSFTKHFDN